MPSTAQARAAHTAQRLAAAAPAAKPDEYDPDAKQLLADQTLHELCEAWSAWCRTRRFFGRPSMPASLLGKLTSRTRVASQPGGPNAPCNAQLAALHLAVLGQPADALDRQVFELHYLWRVRNVKAAASAVGISRQHWYRLVRDFRARVAAAGREIQQDNETQGAELQAKHMPQNAANVTRQSVTSTGDNLVLENR
jgi:hypothetical protein